MNLKTLFFAFLCSFLVVVKGYAQDVMRKTLKLGEASDYAFNQGGNHKVLDLKRSTLGCGS